MSCINRVIYHSISPNMNKQIQQINVTPVNIFAMQAYTSHNYEVCNALQSGPKLRRYWVCYTGTHSTSEYG